MTQLAISKRIRSTPFTDRVEAAGVSAYTVYNHMLLPAMFRSLEEDCAHLKSAVQIWDVSCERQVEFNGPDAGRLAQLLTPRDLSRQTIGQCLYSPTCDADGRLLNDPVTIKLAEDRFWVSIADSDVILFAKGLAAGLKLNVRIHEPDISPLAVQGPRADDLMARVFGETIRDTRFFGTQLHSFGGRDHLIARSGYSGQGGFEIYLNGGELGHALWDRLMEEGQDLDVRAGGPNLIERIESGLLSYGNDMTAEHSLSEAGLDRFCKTISPDCLAHDALIKQRDDGPPRQLRYIKVDGDKITSIRNEMPVSNGATQVGQISSLTWSPTFETNVGIGMFSTPFATADTRHECAAGAVTILSGPAVKSLAKSE